MTNLKQQLKELVRRTNDPCGDCTGTGFVYISPREDYENSGTKPCPTCQGKGYVEKLEFGCEVEFNDRKGTILQRLENNFVQVVSDPSYSTTITMEEKNIIKNLGKPLTLQEILLALSKSNNKKTTMTTRYENGLYIIPQGESPAWSINIPLNLSPSEYPEELINKLIEIL